MTDSALVHFYHSPIGWIRLGLAKDALISLDFAEVAESEAQVESTLLQKVIGQLDSYFLGKRAKFDVTLRLTGTEFQLRVWKRLMDIPYGETTSYLEIAQELGKPNAARAVGAANGSNPISIIVPCHRVVGSSGRLTGYGGGIWRKEWLLRHEGALLM